MPFVVRLTGSDGTQGDIEIFDKDHERWKAMCDDGWNLKSATVVCRQLNLGPPISIYSHSTGRNSYNYGIESVICVGTESNIAECNYTTDHDCYGDESAGVICSPSKFSIIATCGMNLWCRVCDTCSTVWLPHTEIYHFEDNQKHV